MGKRIVEDVKLPEVDGAFTIVQLPAERGYQLLLDIVAVMLPGASRALGGAPGIDFGKLDVSTLLDGLDGFVKKANREEVNRIRTELFSGIEWNNSERKLPVKGANLDIIFEGQILGIFLLQKEALRVNYTGFYKGLAESVRAVFAEAKAKRSTELSTSGGPSGDSSLSA